MQADLLLRGWRHLYNGLIRLFSGIRRSREESSSVIVSCALVSRSSARAEIPLQSKNAQQKTAPPFLSAGAECENAGSTGECDRLSLYAGNIP